MSPVNSNNLESPTYNEPIGILPYPNLQALKTPNETVTILPHPNLQSVTQNQLSSTQTFSNAPVVTTLPHPCRQKNERHFQYENESSCRNVVTIIIWIVIILIVILIIYLIVKSHKKTGKTNFVKYRKFKTDIFY